MMKILGIDPGSRKAGFGLVMMKGKKVEYLASGTLRYDCQLPILDRLGEIYLSCIKLVEKYQPDEIAIEALIHVKNVSSLAKLAQARGAMIAAMVKSHRGKIFEYSPTMIKSTVTGHGFADKMGIQKFISMMLGNMKFDTDDESDALAIAICHGIMLKPSNLMRVGL